MQPDRNDHQVRAPAVDFTHNTEGDLLLHVHDIAVGIFNRRMVLEHQEDPGNGQDQKNKKGKPAHAPGVFDFDRVFRQARRVKVQKNAVEHNHRTLAFGLGDTRAEDRLAYLRR